MTINICPDRIRGNLGGVSIEPQTTSLTQDGRTIYTITLEDTSEDVPDVEGEFRIETTGLQTGEFSYIFDDQQVSLYNIRQNENGFLFRLTTRDARITFTLISTGFYGPYQGALVVDAFSSNYGSDTAQIIITPEFEVVQADNFTEYATEEEISAVEEVTIEEVPKVKIPQTDKFSVINEYNFYSKQFEETTIPEKNLLNINQNISTRSIKQYFSNKNIVSQNQQIIILQPNTYVKDLYPKYDKQKFLFPMFVETKFQTDIGKTEFVSILEKLGILDYFCYFYIYKLSNKNTTISNIINQIEKTNERENTILLRQKYKGNVSNIASFARKSFQKTILIKVLEKQLSITPFIAHDEVLMYKISKYKGNVLVNEQYFINNFDNKELVYFDTQIKYDTEYRYQISKIFTDSQGNIKQEEIKEYNALVKVLDSPPLSPDITFIPYKGVDDQIQINFNASIGRYSDYPVIIKETDKEIFNKALEYSVYSRFDQNENKVQFEADDITATFELYRLDKPPSSYEDFRNAMMLETENTALVDDIKPNTKYYYISRTRDIHGNLSNPTKPIQVEMINQDGTIYLVKKEYVFGEEAKILSKNIKNIIQIKLAKQQININREKTYDSNPEATTAREVNVVLSDKDIAVWNKQFLMRVVSKQTGKKIDIKFAFSYSQPN